MNYTERPNFIDYSKAIGIYLVVFGHYVYFLNIPFKDNLLWHTTFNVFSFHMPLFFIISGYLFKFTNVNTCLSKGRTQLIIPYLSLSLICLVLGSIRAFLIDVFTIQRILMNILGIISASDLSSYYGTAYSEWSGPLWFVYSLFFIKMYMEIAKNIKNKWILYSLILITIVGLSLTIYKKENILAFRISSTITGLAFFSIGYFAKTYIYKIANLKIYKLVILFAFSLMLLMLSLHFNMDYSPETRVSMFSSKFGRYPYLFFVGGITGTLMIMSISQILSRFKSKIILTISNGAIIILGFQQIIFLFFSTVFRDYVTSNHLYFALLFSLLVTAICYILIIISGKYFPFLLGSRKLK